MKLYVVMMSEGEYSDRQEWVGGVFNNKEVAEGLVTAWSARAREYVKKYQAWLRGKKIADADIDFTETYRDFLKANPEHDDVPTESPHYWIVETELNEWRGKRA